MRQPNVTVEDGNLVKIDRKKRVKASPDRKQHVYSQLIGIEQARRYKHGWAARKYQEFFGVWPRGLYEVSAAPSDEILSWVKSRQIAFAKSKQKAERGAHGQD